MGVLFVLNNAGMGDKLPSASRTYVLSIVLASKVFSVGFVRCELTIAQPANVACGIRRKSTIVYTLFRVIFYTMLFQRLVRSKCFITSVKATKEFRWFEMVFVGFDMFLDFSRQPNTLKRTLGLPTSIGLGSRISELMFVQRLFVREACVAYQALKRRSVVPQRIVNCFSMFEKSFSAFKLFSTTTTVAG